MNLSTNKSNGKQGKNFYKRKDLPKGWLSPLTHQQITRLVMAHLLKGGFIKYLLPEKTVTDARARDKKSPDWGFLRKTGTGKRGRVPYKRIELYCAYDDCNTHLITKGKDHVDAVMRAWKVGWVFIDDIALCRKHKPGRPDGRWEPGGFVYDRDDGSLFKILRYVSRGSHPLNVGAWPELWCLNEKQLEKVFIFWDNRPPPTLAIVPKMERKVRDGRKNSPEVDRQRIEEQVTALRS